MPRPGLPPTPASSTDIMAQDKPRRPSLETSFSLPPPAMIGAGSETSSISSVSGSGSSFHPVSPVSPEMTAGDHASKRRPSNAKKISKDDFTLPPPPTRSRKIIQMKPKTTSQDHMSIDSTPEKGKSSASKTKQSATPSSTTGKRKQPSSTSAAGRKIARKTAHSLIERRRRSKMNEEFGVLKDMVPACQDQEMHKLAILQASIEYLRYLEQCIQDLKANNDSNATPNKKSKTIHSINTTTTTTTHPYTHHQQQQQQQHPPPSPSHNDAITSPTFSPRDTRHFSFSTSMTPTAASPSFGPSSHQQSQSPYLPARSNHYPYATAVSIASSALSSVTPSPALGPSSVTPSPALAPQRSNSSNGDVDMDHEATAALLMLNTGRRGSRPGTAEDVQQQQQRRGNQKAMSVMDLLSA